MIAEVILPKSGIEASGKEISDLYDEERQGKFHYFFLFFPLPSSLSSSQLVSSTVESNAKAL